MTSWPWGMVYLLTTKIMLSWSYQFLQLVSLSKTETVTCWNLFHPSSVYLPHCVTGFHCSQVTIVENRHQKTAKFKNCDVDKLYYLALSLAHVNIITLCKLKHGHTPCNEDLQQLNIMRRPELKLIQTDTLSTGTSMDLDPCWMFLQINRWEYNQELMNDPCCWMVSCLTFLQGHPGAVPEPVRCIPLCERSGRYDLSSCDYRNYRWKRIRRANFEHFPLYLEGSRNFDFLWHPASTYFLQLTQLFSALKSMFSVNAANFSWRTRQRGRELLEMMNIDGLSSHLVPRKNKARPAEPDKVSAD